jgi:hypothetical protein
MMLIPFGAGLGCKTQCFRLDCIVPHKLRFHDELRIILDFVWKMAFRLGRGATSLPDESDRSEKGKPRGDRPRGFLHFAAEPDGQPVGGVKSAAPGYHYTMGSPPILWSLPSRLWVTTSSGWASVRRATVARPICRSLPKFDTRNQAPFGHPCVTSACSPVPLPVRKTIPAGERLMCWVRSGGGREPLR